jgi:hypothetical protein
VDVLVDPGPSRFTQIDTQVKSIWMIGLLYCEFTSLGEFHHVCGLLFGTIRKIGNVLIGTDHQMTTGVRENIKYDKIVLTTEKDKLLLVSFRRTFDTKYTAPCIPLNIGDVLVSPGAP